MRYKYFIPLFFVFSILNAQETFSTGFKIYSNLNKNNFHNYWDQKDPGAGIFVKIPFYKINLTTGCDYFSFIGKPVDSSYSYNGRTADFYSMLIFGGLEKEFNFYDMSFVVGIKAGNNRMVFDDDIVDEAIKSETELYFGYYGELYYTIMDNLYAGINIEYNKTYLHKPVELLYGGAGIYYRFDMPQLLKEVLK